MVTRVNNNRHAPFVNKCGQINMCRCMYTYILIYVQTDTHIECVCVYSYTGVCTITHLLYLKYDD